MTKEEFIAIKEHTRIKYTGSDIAVLTKLASENKSAQAKGLVVSCVRDYGDTLGNYYWVKEDKAAGLAAILWNGSKYKNIVPADWIVADAKRTDLTRNREKQAVKSTNARVREELGQFSNYFRKMKDVKYQIDSWLDDLPLASRFKILTSLSDEQKAWLELLDMDPEVVIQQIKKIAEAEPEGTIPMVPVVPTVDSTATDSHTNQ